MGGSGPTASEIVLKAVSVLAEVSELEAPVSTQTDFQPRPSQECSIS